MTFPASWRTYRLGELADYINGRAFKPEDWGSVGLPIVRIQNLNDPTKPFNYYSGMFAEKNRIHSGDVLLSWSGTPGTSFGCFIWSRGEALLNQHIFKVLVNEELILKEYFVHATNGRLDEMIGLAHGAAGLRHITKAKLETIEIHVPPLDEQRRIVDRIENCLVRVAEIEVHAASVALELDALFPSLLNERFSAIRDAHGARLLEDVADIRGGGSLPSGSAVDEGSGSVLLVKVGDMNADGNERVIKVAREFFPRVQAGRGIVEAGAVIFPKRGGAIATNKKRLLGRPALLDPNLMAVVGMPDVLRSDYLYYWCLTLDLAKLSNGGVIPQLNRKDLAPLMLPVPGLAAQAAIVHGLQEAERHCAQMKTEFESAQADRARLREAVLRKAFAGEL